MGFCIQEYFYVSITASLFLSLLYQHSLFFIITSLSLYCFTLASTSSFIIYLIFYSSVYSSYHFSNIFLHCFGFFYSSSSSLCLNIFIKAKFSKNFVVCVSFLINSLCFASLYCLRKYFLGVCQAVNCSFNFLYFHIFSLLFIMQNDNKVLDSNQV